MRSPFVYEGDCQQGPVDNEVHAVCRKQEKINLLGIYKRPVYIFAFGEYKSR